MEQNKSTIMFKSSKVTKKNPLETKPATLVANKAATETEVSLKSDAAKNKSTEIITTESIQPAQPAGENKPVKAEAKKPAKTVESA